MTEQPIRKSPRKRARQVPEIPVTGHQNPGIDQILSHWIVKLCATVLIGLAGYIYNDQLSDILKSIEVQTGTMTELKADLSEFKAEQRSFQNVTTAQYTALATRVDSLERDIRDNKEQAGKRLAEWQRTYQEWLEEDTLWKKKRGKRR